MRIESIETFVVRAEPRGAAYWGKRAWGGEVGEEGASYPVAARRRVAYSATIDAVLVKVVTSDGDVGWGEAKAPVASPATASIIEELLVPVALGSRLDEIGVTWERMFATMTNRGHMSGFLLEAIAGIDIALWDAWGHALGQPLWALLGGRFRDAVPVYASGVPAAPVSGLAAVREQAQSYVDRGFKAIKVAIGADPRADVESARVVREVLGNDGTLLVDASGNYDVAQAEWVGRRLVELEPGFFEMPLHPENLAGYASLARKLPIPLALDTLATRGRALEFLRAEALHVLQPDVNRAGGITGTMRISALADAFGAQSTPHVSIGSAVHFAASLQCALATPNLELLEHWAGDNPLGEAVAHDLDEPLDGMRTPGAGAGLGITIDEDAVRALSTKAVIS